MENYTPYEILNIDFFLKKKDRLKQDEETPDTISRKRKKILREV